MAEPNRLTGCLIGPCDNESIVSKPVIFLGGTVLSFNASLGIGPTQESTLSVDIINDCQTSGYTGWTSYNDPQGDFFYGYPKIGAPVFFSVCEAMKGDKVGCEPNCFEFGGILTNYTATQSSSGRTFNAKVVDPRSLLDSAILIVGNYIEGPIKHRNYFNIYAYYEKNVLPLSQIEPEPTGLLIPNSPGFPTLDLPIVPSGDQEGSDCSVFGTAIVDDAGMSYRKILQALKEIKPLIYIGNYNQEYNPELGGRDLAVATQQQPNPGVPKLLHENNVLQLDLTGFPEDVPQYYKVAGPSVSILELLTNVCDTLGREFIVTLEKNPNFPNQPHTIVVQTKKIDDNAADATIRDNILYYDGKSTEFSYGKELRLDKNRTVLIGEQEHFMFESSIVDFYFGEDKDGNPIVPLTSEQIDLYFPEYSGCGFVLPIEIDELNSSLQCPLWDYLTDQVVDRKALITEEDIRCALSSEQLWKTRVLSSGIVGDFNRLIRYNFPDETNELVRENLRKFTQIGNTLEEYEENPSASGSGEFVRPSAGRAFADAMQLANDRYSIANRYNKASELEKVHQYIQNIGKTYYGRQYLVSLKTDDNSVLNVCALPADFYDENYFGLGTGVYNPGESIIVSGCGSSVTIPAGSVYRDTIYSHIPTNAGGWVDPCARVLGINDDGYKYSGKDYPEASLSFFREEDDRVAPFARFDTKELYIKYKANFVEPTGSLDDTKDEDVVQGEIQSTVGSFIANACGVVDISLFDFDEYLIVRPSGGYCENPASKQDQQEKWDGPANTGIIEAQEDNIITWVKAQVEEKIYIIESSGIACCSGCPPASGCKIPKAVIKFSNPILKRPCNDSVDFAETILFTAQALNISSEIINATGTGVIISGGLEAIQPSRSICGIPTESGLAVLEQMQVASDSANSNSYGYYPAADRPSRVAIPLRSNITTYGPWYSSNFESSAGGVNFNQDTDLAPWNYGELSLMDKIADGLAKSAESNIIEFETGSVTYPYWPELKLGFLQNGPNLTNISVVYGSNGVTTNYTWQTYTPKFGNLKNLENQHLKDAYKNRLKAQKIVRQQKLESDQTNSKVKNGGNNSISNSTQTENKDNTRNKESQNRVLVGEMYDFGIIRDSSGVIKDFSQRVVVGSETLNKMVLDLRYDYSRKAFMSFDGIFSPVSVSGGGIAGIKDDYVLPRFAAYSPRNSVSIKCGPLAPVPPFMVEVLNPNDTGIVSKDVLNLNISRNYLNPLTNPFAPSGHYHSGSGAGHSIDIVGRDEYDLQNDPNKLKPYIPGKGIMNSFYGQTEWDRRYANDYRFLGLRGPLVLHSWGYDTQGKPIPNAIDDYDKIMQSGHFEPSGLKDEFYEDWLQKPATWPVAPVDLRFDRERGVWVSPPQHKIVVAKASTNIEPYGTGSGILIDDRYGYSVYDASGNLIDTSEGGDAIIEIEDRIGSSWSKDQKAYAYYDTFTSKYLLLAGGGGSSKIKIGRFMNQWPSIGNVKDPYNAIKEVHLYAPRSSGCPASAVEDFVDKDFCPWVLEPQMRLENGVRVADTVKAMNLLSNVAAGEYQAKWCMIVEIDNYYYLLAAEC